MELTHEHYRGTIFYDFKVKLNQQDCLQRLQLTYGNEATSCDTVLNDLQNVVEVEIFSWMKNTHEYFY